MTPTDRVNVRNAYLSSDMTPMEVARSLDLPPGDVIRFIERYKLSPFAVGKHIRKATAADAYWPPND